MNPSGRAISIRAFSTSSTAPLVATMRRELATCRDLDLLWLSESCGPFRGLRRSFAENTAEIAELLIGVDRQVDRVRMLLHDWVTRISADRHGLQIRQDFLEQSEAHGRLSCGHFLPALRMSDQIAEDIAVLDFKSVGVRHAETGQSAASALRLGFGIIVQVTHLLAMGRR